MSLFILQFCIALLEFAIFLTFRGETLSYFALFASGVATAFALDELREYIHRERG